MSSSINVWICVRAWSTFAFTLSHDQITLFTLPPAMKIWPFFKTVWGVYCAILINSFTAYSWAPLYHLLQCRIIQFCCCHLSWPLARTVMCHFDILDIRTDVIVIMFGITVFFSQSICNFCWKSDQPRRKIYHSVLHCSGSKKSNVFAFQRPLPWE